MSPLTKHWTERSTDDFLYRIGADFVRQLENAMQSDPDATRASLAKKLDLSKGRISQFLNNPGNLTLRKMIEYARAVGLKVTVVAYDDGDSENRRGPINAEVFTGCWDMANKPTDFFELESRRIHYFVPQGLTVQSATNSQMMQRPVSPSSFADTSTRPQ